MRGKWLQFDCPHCLRPMRLIAEDAGGLVDCAHCGLELVAPDPAIGRGARLSRASEGRVGSLSRYNLRNLREDQIKHSKTNQPEDPGPFSLPDDDGDDDGDDDDIEELADSEIEEALDPNHALARGSAAEAQTSKRAVKALEPDKVGKSFRRQKVLAERAIASSKTEWEPLASERPVFANTRQDRYGFWIALAITVVVMFGIVMMAVKEASKSTEVFDPEQISQIRSAQAGLQSRFDKSFAAAKEALASPSWEALIPLVRDPKRVAPLMRSYYSEVKYEPVELVEFHAPVEVTVSDLPMHELAATEKSGKVRTLVLEQCEDGPRVDWELMVNLPRHTWNKFLEARPAEPQTISVVAARSSVLDRYFDDAGVDRDEAIGIRVWHGPADSHYAVLPKGSEMAEKMSELLEWDKGRKIVIEASFDPESKLNDRLNFDGFYKTGWVMRSEE